MRHFFLFAICLFFALNCNPQITTNASIIGKWKVTGDDVLSYITFDSNGFVSFREEDLTVRGDSFYLDEEIGEEPVSMTYQIHDSLNPHQIIISILDFRTKKAIRVSYGIYQFIGKDKLKLYINTEDETIPNKFDPSETEILLRITD